MENSGLYIASKRLSDESGGVIDVFEAIPLSDESGETINIFDIEAKPLLDESGKVIAVVDFAKKFHIIDYSYSSDYRTKKVLNSIDELKIYLGKLINIALAHINYKDIPVGFSKQTEYDIGSIESIIGQNKLQDEIREIIVNQLVFDVLFDKYLSDQRTNKILRSKYSGYMSEILTEVIQSYKENKIYYPDTICRAIERKMNNYANMMTCTKMKDDLSKFGIDADKYIKYMDTPNKSPTPETSNCRPKVIWDYFFYNSYMLSGIQYNRKKIKSTKESVNYTYTEKIEDISKYYDFETALLSSNRIVYKKWVDNNSKNEKNRSVFCETNEAHKESAEDFYIKMMEYYFLETYKRVDFMLKFAITLTDAPSEEFEKEGKYLHIIKRFHPMVLCPKIDKDNNIEYAIKHNYYRPMIFVEEKVINEIYEGTNKMEYAYSWLVYYNIIRAKAYELFNFHALFESSDYEDIKRFLINSYNLRNFHESVNIKNYLKSSTEFKKIYSIFIELNNELFPGASRGKSKFIGK